MKYQQTSDLGEYRTTDHTPGPWVFKKATANIFGQIKNKGGAVICDFQTEPTSRDAQLMIAAPDLLKALQSLYMDDMTHDYDDFFNKSELADKARAAIAKATGASK